MKGNILVFLETLFFLPRSCRLTSVLPRIFFVSLFFVMAGSELCAFTAQTTHMKDGKVIRVGPTRELKVPSEAAKIAKDGDTIEIDAAEYRGDVALWIQNNLTIKGVNGRPHLIADGKHIQGKSIWITRGKNITIENIEFSGTRVRDKNGAGIRHEGQGLVLRSCFFHNNENGILTGHNPLDEILIEYCEFANNGLGKSGYTHNIYIGRARRFAIRFSNIHHVKHGQQVKSRASENYIFFNRIMDEKDGKGSRAIDLPNGGKSFVVGNVLQQSVFSENRSFIGFAHERGVIYKNSSLRILNNTFVNEAPSGTLVWSKPEYAILVANNIFLGVGDISNISVKQKTNLRLGNYGTLMKLIMSSKDYGFAAPDNYDFRLTAASPAVDAGTDLRHFGLAAKLLNGQYGAGARGEARSKINKIDIGAFEYVKEGAKQ